MMEPLNANDPDTRSAEIVAENIEQLRSLSPEVFTEGKVHFDVLRHILRGGVQEGGATHLEVTRQIEGSDILTSNPEANGRFHTNWLSMMYPRLKLARNLLSPDGVLICTIDDNELATLGMLLKEIFGEGTYDQV